MAGSLRIGSSKIGRDAIQVGHATEVRVDDNTGSRIGYPVSVVDMEGGGMPVAIDTAGNVDKSVYEENRISRDQRQVHRSRWLPSRRHPWKHLHGTSFPRSSIRMVTSGSFSTTPIRTCNRKKIRVIGNVIDGTKFGGIFVIGRGHTIQNNQLLRLNMAGCNESHSKFGCIYNAKEPDVLQTGIYLGGSGRAARSFARERDQRQYHHRLQDGEALYCRRSRGRLEEQHDRGECVQEPIDVTERMRQRLE